MGPKVLEKLHEVVPFDDTDAEVWNEGTDKSSSEDRLARSDSISELPLERYVKI